jgi:hypothetical protein
MGSRRPLSLDLLPQALRDRAGKVAGQDRNTAEYLDQAAAAVVRLRRELDAERRAHRALRAEYEAIEWQ